MLRPDRLALCLSFVLALASVACGDSRADRQLAVQVGQEIANSPVLSDSHIEVAAHDRVVQLAGVVGTQEQAQSAERLAWSVDGVKGVESHLRIDPALTGEPPPVGAPPGGVIPPPSGAMPPPPDGSAE